MPTIELRHPHSPQAHGMEKPSANPPASTLSDPRCTVPIFAVPNLSLLFLSQQFIAARVYFSAPAYFNVQSRASWLSLL